MNIFFSITRKRNLKLTLFILLDFYLSLAIIKFILESNFFYFKKIFNIDQLIIFLIFWIFISYVRGRYILNSSEKITLKLIKDFKEIIIVSSTVLIGTFILKILSIQDSFTSKNILLIYSVLIPISLFNQFIFHFLFENKKAKIINIFVLSDSKSIKYIKENLTQDENYEYKFRKINCKQDIDFIPDHLILSFEEKLNEENKNIIQYMYVNRVEIYSTISWCEKFLKRIPYELFDINESINKEINQNEKSIQIRLKRIGDITLGFMILISSLPIIIISGIFIWLNDRGPIFYSQNREGLYGRNIKIVKLRTMKINAEEEGPQWSTKNDKRVTYIGRILRRTRIDELPQILSVIKGEMSLIGPRPERPEFNKEFNELIPNYYLRTYAKPGLSGWAQVNYPYGASLEDTKNKLSYDFYYIRNFSFWIDFLILFKTARIVFSGAGSIPK